MNRKLGQLIKAAVITLPFALPGVALAQSAGSTSPSGGAYDNTNQPNQNAPVDKSMQEKGTTPESTGTPGTPEKTPPAGDLDTSGTSKTTDHNAAGSDINKPSKMDTDTNKSKSKKDTGDTGNDLNR